MSNLSASKGLQDGPLRAFHARMINSARTSRLPSLAICLMDETGEIVASNEAHAVLLQRRPEHIIGRNWRDWTPADQLATAEQTFAKVLTGEPTEFTRRILRADGRLVVGRSRKFATMRFNRPLVIGTLKVLHVEPDRPVRNASDLADYIHELTAELARMAERHGLHKLHEKLLDVSSDAGEVATLLDARVAGRH
jgi:PAS domain S-box-containing protein